MQWRRPVLHVGIGTVRLPHVRYAMQQFKGVKQLFFWAVLLALSSERNRVTWTCPFWDAKCMTSTCPFCDAKCKGVDPSLTRAVMLAPCSTRNRVTSICPLRDAKRKGVHPSLSSAANDFLVSPKRRQMQRSHRNLENVHLVNVHWPRP